MKTILTTRMETLKASLDEMGKDEYGVALLKEFQQLIRIYQQAFPNQNLLIKDIDPKNYID